MPEIICEWSAFWRVVTGWWTPGWGNLFTVAVAIIAIGVSAWFNLRTLRSADKKFQQGRIDARNDKLRGDIAAFMDAVGERASQLDVFTHRINELVKAYLPDNPPGALAQFQQSSKAVLSETLSDAYRRTATHTFAINILTDDPGILDHVNRIQGVVGAEQPGSVLEIDLTRAIKRFCEAHHGCDVSERNASPAQGGVDVLSN
jgi:hypothetical protein